MNVDLNTARTRGTIKDERMSTERTPFEAALAAADLQPVPVPIDVDRRLPYVVAEGMIDVNGQRLLAQELSNGERIIDSASLHALLDEDAFPASAAGDLRREAAVLSIFLPSELTRAESAIVRAAQSPFVAVSHHKWMEHVGDGLTAASYGAVLAAEHEFLFGEPLMDCAACAEKRRRIS